MKQGWKIKRLGEVCNNAGNIRWQDVGPSAVLPYIDLSAVDRDSSSIREYQYVNSHNAPSRAKQIVKEGDVIFATTRPTLKRLCVITPDFNDAICSTGFCVLRPTESILTKWLFYNLKSDAYYTYIEPLQKGASYPAITDGEVRNYELPIPSLAEQERIVEILDREFERIDALKANAEKSLQHAKELFQSALRQELHPKKGWETAPMNKIYDVRDGTHDSPRYHTTGYPLITSKNLCEDFIDMDNVKYISKEDYDKINERSKVDVGDVLFAMIGTIGNPTLVAKEPNFAIKNMALFKVPNNQSGSLLRYILSTDEVLGEMKKKAKGANQPFVSLGYLRSFEISIPATREQQDEIVARLDILNERCKALEENYKKTIALCDDMKQALLRKAFNGEL